MKESRVLDFYVLCNKLKNVIRTGWLNWGVDKDRVESIAEHVYGVQMLAIAMWSEYDYDIDINRVLSMLAIHELEETVIGDLTLFDVDNTTKQDMGHKAIEDILGKLCKGATFKDLIMEFDSRSSPEAQFAYMCDKLEADLQCKLYDEANCVDIHAKHNNSAAEDKLVKSLLDSGDSWSTMWLKFGQTRYNYDDNFMAVSNYAMNNHITK